MQFIDTIRISDQAKDKLVKLKRLTGLQHWNELCRWGLCYSLAEPSIPPPSDAPSDSPIEMNWKVFAGTYGPLYEALMRHRCRKDGLPLDNETLSRQLRLHIHRGINYLAAEKTLTDISSIILKLPLKVEGENRPIETQPESNK